jgi:hypothetical protein
VKCIQTAELSSKSVAAGDKPVSDGNENLITPATDDTNDTNDTQCVETSETDVCTPCFILAIYFVACLKSLYPRLRIDVTLQVPMSYHRIASFARLKQLYLSITKYIG